MDRTEIPLVVNPSLGYPLGVISLGGPISASLPRANLRAATTGP